MQGAHRASCVVTLVWSNVLPESRGLSSTPRRYRFSGHFSICMHGSEGKCKAKSVEMLSSRSYRMLSLCRRIALAVAIGRCTACSYWSRPCSFPAWSKKKKQPYRVEALAMSWCFFGGVRGSWRPASQTIRDWSIHEVHGPLPTLILCLLYSRRDICRQLWARRDMPNHNPALGCLLKMLQGAMMPWLVKR
jgi:hypothetical protein